ncbi:MAG: rRNA pseudouridine synthase [Chitinophagaceae bacterium]|nr:rRNA pseudouridine synthase [Chitinophagaceae bacterium]
MQKESKRYFILNKPYNMVSQFVSSHDVPLLGKIDFNFPEGTHAIGRLDSTSEGLLILTTDKTVTRKLFLANTPHTRTYLVMVQNKMTLETLDKLRDGIEIKIKNGESYCAKPFSIKIIEQPASLYKYATDYREVYAHTWLLITLTEGKFRQVRKMVLAVKHRCLRLIRLNISGILLGDMNPGEVKEIPEDEFYALLKHPAQIPFN